MIGALIGAGLGVAGSIFGGIQSSRAARKAKAEVEEQRRSNQAWFDRRYNEDALQRADAQRLLAMTQDSLRRSNRNARGVQAVVGASEESIANQQVASNQVLADTASSIASNADARKDAIEAQYRQTDNALSGQLAGIEQSRAQATAQATAGVLSAAGGIASAGLGDIGANASISGVTPNTDALKIKPNFSQFTSLSKLK